MASQSAATLPSDELVIRAKAELELRRRREQSIAQFIDPDPVRWIKTHFYVPEVKDGPMPLYPFHEAGLREALAIEEDGRFRYSTVVWSAIKKSIKSTMAAAVALWFAWQTPWSTIKVIANDQKQAASRVHYYIERCLTLNREMGKQVRIRGYKMTFPNHSTIEAIPIDPAGEAGANDDLVIYSEIWGWRHDAAKKMWTETTLSPLKFGHSIRWCETYAGFVGESPILEELYDRGVVNGACIDETNEFYRNDRLFVIWNTKPTVPWQTPEYYAQESANLMDVEFERIHRNQWGTSVGSFVYAEQWAACQSVSYTPSPHDPVIVAMDAAVSGDCFGILALCRIDGIVKVIECRKWVPPKDGKIDYIADDGPEAYVAYLCDRYSVLEVDYDEYQLHSTATRLRQQLVTFFRVFQQGGDRLIADKMLQDAIRARTVEHNGDTDLASHVLNALAKAEGEKIRLVKKNDKAKIDLAVCLSMAHSRAVELDL